MIATIALRKKVQRSYGNHSPAIAATTIAEEWFYMIAMITEVFFFRSARSDHGDGSDHMETGL